MANSKTQERREKQIEFIYKNLGYVSSAYCTVEQVFPLWEAAFALIIGQLIVAYFNPNAQRCLISFIGIILSSIWFILASLNYQYSLHMERKLNVLHDRLNKNIHDPTDKEKKFVSPWPTNDEKKTWTGKNIFWGMQDGDIFGRKALKSTWFYRRLLPFILLLIWILLLTNILGGLWGAFVIAVLIVVILIYFDP